MTVGTIVRGVPWVLPFAVLVACSGAAPNEGDSESSALGDGFVDTAVLEPGGAHMMPLRDPGAPSIAQAAKVAATSGPHLTYYGGKVISNVKVVEVLYGSGTYLGNISGSATPTLASFYGQYAKSSSFTWLSEYDTSSQKIGAGSFLEQKQITPASSRNKSTITDTQIQQEISAQIGAKVIPAPDANTIYMVSFPKGKHISMGGTKSCVAGGFCAYHGTFKRNGQEVYYGVLPDMSAGSGCDTGCGSGSQFGNQTAVASHELTEAVTDAEVGLATTVGAPLAWYDATNGEIGDICNGEDATFTGSDGHTYSIQKLWSNAKNACIAHK